MDGNDNRNQTEPTTITVMCEGKVEHIRIAPVDPTERPTERVTIISAQVIRAAEWQQVERIESDAMFMDLVF